MKIRLIWPVLVTLLMVGCGKKETHNHHLYPASSSVPPIQQPLAIAIPKANKSLGTETKNLADYQVRVLIFPHDMKGGAHGGVDDATTVTFEPTSHMTLLAGDQQIIFKKKIKINFINNKLQIDSTETKGQIFESFTLTSDTSIKVFRKDHPKASHKYEGIFNVTVEGKGIKVVNELNIEKYLRGVVPSEVSSSWPIEAIKAQTLAARSYAFYYYLTASKKRDYHVDDTARYQVYTGLDRAADKTDRAIEETQGQIMTNNGKVIVAFFHSYSGGSTDSSKTIFKRATNYCLGNDEIFSREDLLQVLSKKSHWIVNWETKSYTPKTLLTYLKSTKTLGKKLKGLNKDLDYDLNETTFLPRSKTVNEITFSQGSNEVSVNFRDLRKAIGWREFPGYHYRLQTNEKDEFLFKGHGWGHHVGMSQWGAYMMAKFHAKTYDEILKHYYANISIDTIE